MSVKTLLSPYLTTAEAAEYLRYEYPSAIRTLKMKGLLRPVGRRGGTDLYRREDLDRFVMSGAQLEYPVGDDDWVFPTRNGKLKQPSALTNSIASSAKDAKVKSHITPHRMRYMFSDLLRLAHVDKVTRKAMVGHVTDEMQEHYSNVGIDEKREAMAAAGAKLDEVQRQVGAEAKGYERGYAGNKTKAA